MISIATERIIIFFVTYRVTRGFMLKLKFPNKQEDLSSKECLIILTESKRPSSYTKSVSESTKSLLKGFVKKHKKIEPGKLQTAHLGIDRKIIVVNCHDSESTFEALSLARTIIKEAKTDSPSVLSVISHLSLEKSHLFADAITSAATVADWSFPKYTKKTKERTSKVLTLEFQNADKGLKDLVKKAQISGESNNIVRELSMRAANDLNPKNYVKFLKDAAKKHDFKCEVYTEKKLKTMQAGCFLAVSQASAHRDAAIVKLSYSPKKKSSKSLCLVGKGITYDTGGTCLKPAQYMLGMNGDMGGSAVASQPFVALAKLKANFNVVCYAYLITILAQKLSDPTR